MNLFKLCGSIFIDNEEANKSIGKTDEKATGLGQKFAKGLGTAAKWGAGIVAAAGAGAAALVGVAKNAAGAMDKIDKGSQKVGISKKAYQEWSYVMGQNGMDISKMEVGMKTLVATMDGAASGTESAKEKFESLGLSIYDSSGKLKDQETMMNESLYALANMENGTEKARMATELFGKAGTEMMPMLNGGAEGMKELTDRAHELGLVVSDEAVDAGVKLGDTMDDVKDTFGMIVNKIGVEVMPIVQQGLDFILENMPMIQTVVSAAFGVISEVVMTVGGVIRDVFNGISETLGKSGITFETVMSTISTMIQVTFQYIKDCWELLGKPVFEFIGQILKTVAGYFAQKMPEISAFVKSAFSDIKDIWENNLKPCFKAIGDFLNNVLAPAFKVVFNNVIGPIIDACFKKIKDMWNNSLKPIFTGITDFLTGVFTGNWKKAFGGLADIVKGVFGGLVAVVKAPLNVVIGIINKFIGSVNKLKIPDWVPGVGGKSPNIPNIPLLAKGGTVNTAGRAIVGEAGAEVLDLPVGARVTPLNGSQKNVFNNNDEAINVLMLILEAIRNLNEDLYDIVVAAMTKGVRWTLNEREVARAVKTYA